MELINIKVKKNSKGDLRDGKFYVKELSFDECFELHDKGDKGEDANLRLVQMCLVDEEGERVFKPQQMKLIKERISGVDMMAVLMEANGLNDFNKIAEISEKYRKNSQSDPKTD